jgi:hypothetical protein
MKIYYNPKLMPNDALVRLLICKVPDSKEIKNRKELLPYLNDRWVELIKKTDKDLWALERIVYDWLQMENPFLDSERPQDLADLILESPHYSEILSDPEEIEEYETLDMETAIRIYESETFGDLLELLHEFF